MLTLHPNFYILRPIELSPANLHTIYQANPVYFDQLSDFEPAKNQLLALLMFIGNLAITLRPFLDFHQDILLLSSSSALTKKFLFLKVYKKLIEDFLGLIISRHHLITPHTLESFCALQRNKILEVLVHFLPLSTETLTCTVKQIVVIEAIMDCLDTEVIEDNLGQSLLTIANLNFIFWTMTAYYQCNIGSFSTRFANQIPIEFFTKCKQRVNPTIIINKLLQIFPNTNPEAHAAGSIAYQLSMLFNENTFQSEVEPKILMKCWLTQLCLNSAIFAPTMNYLETQLFFNTEILVKYENQRFSLIPDIIILKLIREISSRSDPMTRFIIAQLLDQLNEWVAYNLANTHNVLKRIITERLLSKSTLSNEMLSQMTRDAKMENNNPLLKAISRHILQHGKSLRLLPLLVHKDILGPYLLFAIKNQYFTNVFNVYEKMAPLALHQRQRLTLYAVKYGNAELIRLFYAALNYEELIFNDLPVYLAAKYGNRAALAELHRLGVNFFKPYPNGYNVSSILKAVENNDLLALKLFHELGFTACLSPHPCPMLFAAKQGYLEPMRLLYELGMPMNTRDSYGRNLSFFAAQNGHLPVLEWLHEINHLSNKAIYFPREVVSTLYQENYFTSLPNTAGGLFITPMQIAAARSHQECVNFLNVTKPKPLRPFSSIFTPETASIINEIDQLFSPPSPR